MLFKVINIGFQKQLHENIENNMVINKRIGYNIIKHIF